MSHKKKYNAPVPPGNQPPSGPPDLAEVPTPLEEHGQKQPQEGTFQEQDPKRRIGNFTGKGEHAYQQPGGKKDADH